MLTPTSTHMNNKPKAKIVNRFNNSAQWIQRRWFIALNLPLFVLKHSDGINSMNIEHKMNNFHKDSPLDTSHSNVRLCKYTIQHVLLLSTARTHAYAHARLSSHDVYWNGIAIVVNIMYCCWAMAEIEIVHAKSMYIVYVDMDSHKNTDGLSWNRLRLNART